MKLSKLFMIALLAGTLGVIGCGDDATNPAGSGGSGGTDPNITCDVGLCLANDVAKADCANDVGTCLELAPGAQQDECIGTALLGNCNVL